MVDLFVVGGMINLSRVPTFCNNLYIGGDGFLKLGAIGLQNLRRYILEDNDSRRNGMLGGQFVVLVNIRGVYSPSPWG